jgi:hypothetical protein
LTVISSRCDHCDKTEADVDENDRVRLLARARRVSSLSSNDVHELKNIYSSGLKPFASDLNLILERAHADDDAVLLKAAIQGAGSLNNNERRRLEEATTKRGKRIPG